MALPTSLDTILSRPDEWAALAFGLLLATVVVLVTETVLGAVVAFAALALSTVPLLPTDVAGEWHYWPAASLVVVVLGLYALGPDLPLPLAMG